MNFKNVFNESCISFDLKANTKKEAVKELAELLEQNGLITNKRKYVSKVMKREKEATTGIGEGISIPHGQCKSVVKPSIAFGRSTKGIEWDAIDDEDVHYVFLLAIPHESNESHIEVLSNLARKLMRPHIREGLTIIDNPSEFYKLFTD